MGCVSTKEHLPAEDPIFQKKPLQCTPVLPTSDWSTFFFFLCVEEINTMNTKSLITLCCLVTLVMPLPGFALDEEITLVTEDMTPCEQAAVKDLEFATQDEIDVYIADCEKEHAHEGMQMEDMTQQYDPEMVE
jgi:hypothetical protein